MQKKYEKVVIKLDASTIEGAVGGKLTFFDPTVTFNPTHKQVSVAAQILEERIVFASVDTATAFFNLVIENNPEIKREGADVFQKHDLSPNVYSAVVDEKDIIAIVEKNAK